MILLGIVLLVVGLLVPRLQILAVVGGVLVILGVCLLLFTPGYAYF